MNQASTKGGGSGSRWARDHRRAAEDGWRQLAADPLSNGVSIALLGLALALPALLLLLVNAQGEWMENWGTEPSIEVFLHTEVDDARAQSLVSSWLARSDVETVNLIGREIAFAEYLEEARVVSQGLTQELALPLVVEVRPDDHTTGVDALDQLVQFLSTHREVDLVVADFEWLKRLSLVSQVAGRGVYLLSGLFCLAGLLVVSNAIQVIVSAHLQNIEVMRIVGATNAYIRRPFLYGGALQGVGAALFGLLLVMISGWFISSPIEALAASYGSEYQWGGLGLKFAVCLLLVGGVIGWVGAWIGVWLGLRQISTTTR